MAKRIIVVDDDTTNLKMAGHILSMNNMSVTALKSGPALIEYIKKNPIPDLILLDIKMPGIDGFETLRLLREIEKEKHISEIPVIFLTADENEETETKGFEVGVSDFIRKPFNPQVLLRRIENIVSMQSEMNNLKSEASTDKLTGFINKAAASSEIGAMCATFQGCLAMIDLDSFKLVNDLYGHDMGDKVLIAFSDIIRGEMLPQSKCARIGGDEFAAFIKGMNSESEVDAFTKAINTKLRLKAIELMGEDMSIPLGASVGAVFVPVSGKVYDNLIKIADKALYTVKKNGKHGYYVYDGDYSVEDVAGTSVSDIRTISEILGERNIPNVALQLNMESFTYVYRYVYRYIVRHGINACKVLFTLKPGINIGDDEYKYYCEEFAEHISGSLRKSDIFVRNRSDQYFVFLTDIREDSTDKVIGVIVSSWKKAVGEKIDISVEKEFIKNETPIFRRREKRVIIVDDDMINLQVAGKILSEGGIHVTALKSGAALLEYMDSHESICDLILLDVKMGDMDGYETLKKLRAKEGETANIPVIFLTADDSEDAETKGLAMGAIDFIRKPFIPEVLLLRVNHILELVALQKQLSYEVENKTSENRNLFFHVVESLATAIDAKDKYTNGHSTRVAEYAKEIAKRAGYSEGMQEEIYIMGLLHDVGKIGIPDEVINKPGKLDDAEFGIIKKHPVMGAHILDSIKERPTLALGAKYHHERYDGKGYPNGLIGEDIPEAARIIAVADAYDAMSSYRSYRDVLSQEMIIKELNDGKQTQFDSRFADIMLSIINEDKDYKLRESKNE